MTSTGKSRLAIGLIGAGRLGRVYARDLASRIAETRLVAIADPVEAVAKEVAAEFDVPKYYAEPLALIDDPAVDAIVIVSPTHTHRELVIAAAGRKKPTFCEKPPALSLDEVAEMLHDAARSQGFPGGVVQEGEQLFGLGRARSHIPSTRFHPVGDRRQRLVELVRQAAGQLADGADAERVGQLALALTDPLLRLLEGFTVAQGLPSLLALRDVFDGQEDQLGTIATVQDRSCVEPHSARADRFEIVLDLEVVEDMLLGQHLRQQSAQLREALVRVLDLLRGDSRALDGSRDRERRKVVGPDGGESASVAADGSAHGRQHDRPGHCASSSAITRCAIAKAPFAAGTPQ